MRACIWLIGRGQGRNEVGCPDEQSAAVWLHVGLKTLLAAKSTDPGAFSILLGKVVKWQVMLEREAELH